MHLSFYITLMARFLINSHFNSVPSQVNRKYFPNIFFYMLSLTSYAPPPTATNLPSSAVRVKLDLGLIMSATLSHFLPPVGDQYLAPEGH